ncbi:MAG: GAF domain-containing protein, partial [Bacteroidota bacterium]
MCFFLAAGGLVLSFVAPELTRLFSVLLGSIIVSLVVLFVFRNRFLNQLMAHLNAGVDMRSDEESIIRKLHAEARERDAAEVMVAGINHIGEEQFLNFVADIKNAQIKLALQQTHEKIVELRRKENEQNWVTQGIAAVAEIKNKTTDITEYASQVMTTVVKMLRANQGSFFVVKKEGTDEYFEFAATYAYGKKKHLQQRINLGEGLIGQAYYERDTIYMTEVPRDYVKITSGLGEALPRCICVVPLLSEGQIYGAIEVASFQKLESYQIQYLTKLAEGVAYNLHAIEVAARTEQLLTESQQMANEVKSQEEELRQNMEELTTTQ